MQNSAAAAYNLQNRWIGDKRREVGSPRGTGINCGGRSRANGNVVLWQFDSLRVVAWRSVAAFCRAISGGLRRNRQKAYGVLESCKESRIFGAYFLAPILSLSQ